MKRRDFLVGSVAATAVAIAKPALALPALMPSKPKFDLQNWKSYLLEKQLPHYLEGFDKQFSKMVTDVNANLVDKHPYLFKHQPMFNVTELRDYGRDKYSIVAMSRALRSQYTCEIRNDLMLVCGLDAETELVHIYTTEIAAELSQFQDEREWMHQAFYIPVLPMKISGPTIAGPATFGFKTRFANANYPYVPLKVNT
jgi:hypothetical protein